MVWFKTKVPKYFAVLRDDYVGTNNASALFQFECLQEEPLRNTGMKGKMLLNKSLVD